MEQVVEFEQEAASADEILVNEWRVEQLERLGIARLVAEAVAGLVDWHELAGLIERGCTPALALEIIRWPTTLPARRQPPPSDIDRERPAVPTNDSVSRARTLSLVSCSLCLRVLRDSDWVDALDAIRRLRKFELPTVVHPEPGLCDECGDLIERRRSNAPQDRLPDAA
jgi:hypothetical protein